MAEPQGEQRRAERIITKAVTDVIKSHQPHGVDTKAELQEAIHVAVGQNRLCNKIQGYFCHIATITCLCSSVGGVSATCTLYVSLIVNGKRKQLKVIVNV